MSGREQGKLARELRRAGYQVTIDGHTHWRVCDAAGRFLANFPMSTANKRWRVTFYTKMRRRERLLAEQDAKEAQPCPITS